MFHDGAFMSAKPKGQARAGSRLAEPAPSHFFHIRSLYMTATRLSRSVRDHTLYVHNAQRVPASPHPAHCVCGCHTLYSSVQYTYQASFIGVILSLMAFLVLMVTPVDFAREVAFPARARSWSPRETTPDSTPSEGTVLFLRMSLEWVRSCPCC